MGLISIIILAGSVKGYSNQTLETFVEALSQFANPKHPEKTLEELQRLYAHIQASPEAERPSRETHIHNVERRLGPEQVERLLAQYAAGDSAQEVGRAFSVGAASVMRLVRQHGLEVHEYKLTTSVIREAAALYESGLSVQRVATRLGVAKPSLLRALKAAGVVMRNPKPPRARPHPESA